MFLNSDLIPKDHFKKIKYRNLIEKWARKKSVINHD